MSARVTVVVATRDRREQVLATLAQLRAHSPASPVVLVDDAGSDGTPEAVCAAFPEVEVLRAPRNLGAGARTLGVRAARTPYVAFADDDSWWAPGALDRAAAHFDASPRLAVLAGRVLVGDEERLDPVCDLMAASPLPRRDDLPGPSVLGFLACGAVVRRRAFLDVGGFEPVIHFLGEEELLARDLAALGWGLAYVDGVVAHHHPARGGARPGRARLQRRNALLSAWMSRPAGVVVRETLRTARDDRGALLDAARRLGPAVAGRRPVPAWVERDLRLLEAA